MHYSILIRFLILEYVGGGELFDHLVKRGRLTIKEVCHFIYVIKNFLYIIKNFLYKIKNYKILLHLAGHFYHLIYNGMPCNWFVVQKIPKAFGNLRLRLAPYVLSNLRMQFLFLDFAPRKGILFLDFSPRKRNMFSRFSWHLARLNNS